MRGRIAVALMALALGAAGCGGGGAATQPPATGRHFACPEYDHMKAFLARHGKRMSPALENSFLSGCVAEQEHVVERQRLESEGER